MRTDRAVVDPSTFRYNLRFIKRVERLAVQKLLQHLAIKGLDLAVSSRRAWFDIEGRDIEMLQPVSECSAPLRSSHLR